mmetsp:Transcript_16291/g.47838  ORF Transcript_16291/g.47838 Transcript_16291/m.47838 type:complete len:283 (+) Transcript_16291:1022-1870(+)
MLGHVQAGDHRRVAVERNVEGRDLSVDLAHSAAVEEADVLATDHLKEEEGEELLRALKDPRPVKLGVHLANLDRQHVVHRLCASEHEVHPHVHVRVVAARSPDVGFELAELERVARLRGERAIVGVHVSQRPARGVDADGAILLVHQKGLLLLGLPVHEPHVEVAREVAGVVLAVGQHAGLEPSGDEEIDCPHGEHIRARVLRGRPGRPQRRRVSRGRDAGARHASLLQALRPRRGVLTLGVASIKQSLDLLRRWEPPAIPCPLRRARAAGPVEPLLLRQLV